MADAPDSKSGMGNSMCGFDPRLRYWEGVQAPYEKRRTPQNLEFCGVLLFFWRLPVRVVLHALCPTNGARIRLQRLNLRSAGSCTANA